MPYYQSDFSKRTLLVIFAHYWTRLSLGLCKNDICIVFCCMLSFGTFRDVFLISIGYDDRNAKS